MKASQVLRILFAAVLILTSLPVTSSADEEYHQSYHNFHITGDAPEGTNGLWFNDETKTYTLESRPDGGFYNVTLSGQATGEGTYCNFVVAANAKANITLDNVEIRIPSGAASLTTAITVDWGSEVNIYLKGNNVLTSAKSAGLSIYGYARIFEAEGGGSLYVSSSYHNAGIRVSMMYWNGIDYIGTLEIYGGSITAVGSQEGAGIGGGAGERVGDIWIHGGFINAIGHYGAGIGGGMIKGGGITVIDGGIVNAVTSNNGGAGIGGGRSSTKHGGDGGIIQILGGLVTAVGGNNGAGIGGGQAQDSGTIEIGGNAIVIARGNGGGAGIGGGLGYSDDGTQGGRVDSVSIFGNSIVFAGSGGDGYSQDIGMGNRGAPEDTIDRVSVLQNAAVFLRHNTLYAYTSAYSGPVLIPPRSYTEMSKFGLELTSLYPPERGRITGYEEHGENWLSDLWDGKIINWWNSAGNVGAFLVLKTLTYTNSQVSGSVPVQVRQHIGTKTTLLNGGELFETPTGYKFGNWVSNEPATYGAGESYTFASDFTLDASWELVTYTIEYVLGEGATVETPNPTFYTYLTPDFELGEPEKTGYTFDGWSGTGIDGTSKDVRIEQYSTGNRLYTANWTPNNYTICYHANNGTQDKREETHTYDTASDLRLNEFEYSGYSFAGWATSPDGDVEYLNGANVKNLAESGVFDLYAKWTAVEYSISYHNLADGEVYPENRTSYTVETPEFTLVNPTREDYTFAGWSGTGIDGMSTEVTIPAGSTGNREYTANWTAVGYTINYNLSGGEVSTPNLGEYTVETPGFTLVNPTREGYTFAGWSGTGIDGMSTEVTIPAGSTGNREYTANWTAVGYTINYNLSGGEVSTPNLEEYTVETPGFTLVNPTRDGYTFAGWSGTGIDGMSTEVTIPAGSTGNREYTANWTAIGYIISYNLSGGEVSTPNLGEYTVETPGFTLVNPTREGYTFAGWSGIGIDGMSTEVTIPAGSTGNREYTANWTATVYSITYDLDGGEVSSENPADYTVETPEFTLVNPTKTGHNFAGWTEEGVEGDPVMTVTIPQGSAGNRTYIAHWTATVITGLPSSFEMHIGERVTWNPKPDGGTWDWDSSFFSASFNSPATFTALKPGTSAITYTVNGVVQKVTVTIRQEVSPDTNQDGDTRMWALALLAAACGAGAVLIWKRKRVKFQNKKA